MRLKPNYSLEYNKILNPELNEEEQFTNFASLIADKDRFLAILPLIEKNSSFIEKKIGTKLPEEIEFFVVRAEKFKSFSSPITIEYSILPEEMLVYLLKEIIKVNSPGRYTTFEIQDLYVNSFVDYLLINCDFGNLDLVKYGKNLHEDSKKKFPEYKFEDLDFSKTTLKEHIEELYKE